MAHSGSDVGKRLMQMSLDGVDYEERNYHEIVNIDKAQHDELQNTCRFLPIGNDLNYVLVPLDVDRDKERDLSYFMKRKNVKILEKPDENGRQVFLPGILAERVVQSPDLPDVIVKKMEQMKVIKQQKFVHIQSFMHLMSYWCREQFLERKSNFQDAILHELRKHKSKELFTRRELKMIAKKILSVRVDITDLMEREMYYIFSTMERMRMYRDKCPYEFEHLERYFTHIAFNFMWHKRICGCCFNDIGVDEFGGFKNCRCGVDGIVTVVNKEQLLQQVIYCCDTCVLTEEVFKLGFTKDDFYFKQTKEGPKALIQNEKQAEEFFRQGHSYDFNYRYR